MRRPVDVARLLVEIVAAVFVAEVAVMFVLPAVAPDLSGTYEALVDAGLLSALAGPVILWRTWAAMKRADRAIALEPSGAPWRTSATTVLVLVTGLLATGAAVIDTTQQVRREARARFEQLSERIVRETERRVHLVRYGLAGMRGLFAVNDTIGRGEFEAYVASRDLPREFPGTTGLGFVEHLNRTDLEAFVSAEWANGAPDFVVRSLGEVASRPQPAPDLYVIRYCFPKEQNRDVWGLDLGSERQRRDAAERALATGGPAITGKIAMRADGRRHPDLLYLLPVYRKGQSPTTPQEREAALVGLVCAPLILDEALAGIVDASPRQIDFEIFDGVATSKQTQLYDYDKHLDHVGGEINPRNYAGRMFEKSTIVDIGGIPGR